MLLCCCVVVLLCCCVVVLLCCCVVVLLLLLFFVSFSSLFLLFFSFRFLYILNFHSDCGGRIGPYIDGKDPDLRNLQTFFSFMDDGYYYFSFYLFI